MRDSIIALSTSVQRPEIDWSADLQFGYDVNSAMLVEKDSILFYGTADGLLLALEAETGRLKWKHRTGVAMVNTVTPISRREVVLSNSDGEVILIESGDFGER